MSVVPVKPAELIAFYEAHIAPWQANVTAIGLTLVDVSDLQTLVIAAQSAAAAQTAARQAAKTATAAYHNAVAQVARAGAGMIGQIRGYARHQNNPNIYTLAQIPAPRTPTPVGQPGMPNSPRVSVLPSGDLNMQWKCKNPANSTGTVYEIRRSVNGGAWEALAAVGRKEHTDTTLPAGASQVSYQVRAVRSTLAGVTAQFDVRLGSGAAPVAMTVPAVPAALKAA